MPDGLRERSVSGDFEVRIQPQLHTFSPNSLQESDFESHAGDINPPGKPGRKKNPK